MKILLISTLCSNKLIAKLFEEEKIKPVQSIQKFLRLLASGFIQNEAVVDTISVIPVSFESKKLLVSRKNEIENSITYSYSPFINVKILNNISVFISSFFRTLTWCFKNRKQKKAVCFDVLKVTVSLGALLACKLAGEETLAIVTDIPGLMVGGGKRNIYSKAASFVNKLYINSFDKYILLTEQMNEVVNLKKRPYIVMEGLVDINMQNSYQIEKADKRIVLYAGGLHERYGLQMLIDAFGKIEGKDIELHLYGHGPMVSKMDTIIARDQRIKYLGIVPNQEVVEAELKAVLLINPRPTHEAFTKYSFPSKNMEYMASGTPLLTTNLPGMPVEYHQYVYLIDEETTAGIYNKLQRLLLNTPKQELVEKGKRAKNFIIRNKNNVIQTKRILNFID